MRKCMVSCFLILLLMVISFPAFSQQNKKDRNFDLIVNASPIAYQKIKYSDNDPSVRKSNYGTGASLGLYTNLNEKISAGVDVSYEFHKFSDFHNYNDLKVNARLRSLLVPPNKDNTLTINYSVGLGADFVFRDDYDYGCYLLMVLAGIDLDVRVSKPVSLISGMDMSFTFQTGSHVFHLTPYIGCIYHFGTEDEQ